ncbi:MAG: TerB family tellurite resistance protein, partial [Byssovorax sp.]
CDLQERREVIRLLTRLAAADGETSEAEHAALETIAAELGISLGDLESVEEEVARESEPRSLS